MLCDCDLMCERDRFIPRDWSREKLKKKQQIDFILWFHARQIFLVNFFETIASSPTSLGAIIFSRRARVSYRIEIIARFLAICLCWPTPVAGMERMATHTHFAQTELSG
jgi:hypothetical protein